MTDSGTTYITAAQVWYVAYDFDVRTGADRTYWEVAAKVLNDLAAK
jgi:hypothetical protein